MRASKICLAVLLGTLSFWPVAMLAQGPSANRALSTDAEITFFIGDGRPGSAAIDSDNQLAEWALTAWQKASQGKLEFVPARNEDEALVRIYFVPPGFGQYGEMRPLEVAGRRGAAVYIRPDTRALGAEIAARADRDPLLRETIVYLTCLHELGHAVGLVHTANFTDIMYSFAYGGDVPEYFARYRREIESRDDITRVSGIADGDRAQLAALYP